MKKYLFLVLLFLFIYINCLSRITDNMVKVDIPQQGRQKSYYVIFSSSKHLNSFKIYDEADWE